MIHGERHISWQECGAFSVSLFDHTLERHSGVDSQIDRHNAVESFKLEAANLPEGNVMRGWMRAIALLMMLALSACATWSPYYEAPQVNITSFALSPETTGGTPVFVIGLQVVNPNRTALSLKGMSYSVDIQDQRILTGAEASLPEVPGYGTAEFTIQASPNLLGSARLVTEVLTGQRDRLHYLFRARFDIGGLLPYITLEEEGEFALFSTGDDELTNN